jgi:hypothetical protein
MATKKLADIVLVSRRKKKEERRNGLTPTPYANAKNWFRCR